MLRDEGGEFAVWADVPPVEGCTRSGEMHQQAEHVIDVVDPGHLGEISALVHHADHVAVRGRPAPNANHLGDPSVDEVVRHDRPADYQPMSRATSA